MSTSPYNTQQEDSCLGGCFGLLMIVAAIWVGMTLSDYFQAQKRALNACPTSAVQHIAYHDVKWYWPFGLYANVRCADGHTVKVGTKK